jgi:hypothetical protein
MITSRLPAIAFSTTERGTETNPLYQHTAVLVQQHSEGSFHPDPNKPALSRAIFSRVYGPLQTEIAKVCGLLTTNPGAAAKRLNDLNRELINHTLQ